MTYFILFFLNYRFSLLFFIFRNTFTILSNLISYAVTWGVLGINGSSDNVSHKDLYKFQVS